LKLIVGLGNPGRKYELTRHNVGFEIIDLFCREVCASVGAGLERARRQDFALVVKGRLGTEGRQTGMSVLLAKPQTFMNSSGVAVASLVSKYGVLLEDLYVIYDDLNLDLGVLRIRRSGSAGGHKGLKSIIDSLGSQSFPRLRVGIGQPPQRTEAIDYVLSRFSTQEREQIEQMEQMAVEALRVMILDGIDSAMNKFNVRQGSGEKQE
jgi:PTH1 family peptidyl-tRNA hydrolase